VNWSSFFELDPGFLNTASLGVPPRAAFAELSAVLAAWEWGQLAADAFEI
jgi:hypothetical protein